MTKTLTKTTIEEVGLPHEVIDEKLRNLVMQLIHRGLVVRYRREISTLIGGTIRIIVKIEEYKTFYYETSNENLICNPDYQRQLQDLLHTLEANIYHLIMDSLIDQIK